MLVDPPTYAQHIAVLVAHATLVGPEGASRCSMFSVVNDLADGLPWVEWSTGTAAAPVHLQLSAK